MSSNKSKKTKKKSHQKKIIHQIFFDMGKGKLKEIPQFYKCYLNNKEYCKKNNIQYKLWSRKQIEKLLDKPRNKQYKKLFYDFKYDIQRVDFGRYLVLWNYGGIYTDLDVCIMNKSINHLFQKEYFFVTWDDDINFKPYNAVIGTIKNNPLYEEILQHSKESFYEKSKQEIYKKWKGRFVFQTTGHYMLLRVLKKNNLYNKKNILNIMKVYHSKTDRIIKGPNPLFEDSNASLWFEGKDVSKKQHD